MDVWQNYRRPPVLEALIDVRIDALPADKVLHLEKLHDALQGEYPSKKIRYQFAGGVQIEGDRVVQSPHVTGPFGYRYESEDGRRIVQFRLDGFTYNRIKPDPDEEWPGWEQIRDEAKPAWTLYKDTFNLVEITRLAVRYINQVVIPAPSIELYDYFTAAPRVPPDLPYQDMLDFSSAVTIKVPTCKALAHVKHYPAPQQYPGAITVALDIDVFRPERLTLSAFSIWELLDQLRALKNTIFEASLFPKTKELFNR
jgi:uncharacterized protein (TIGR04255 family)